MGLGEGHERTVQRIRAGAPDCEGIVAVDARAAAVTALGRGSAPRRRSRDRASISTRRRCGHRPCGGRRHRRLARLQHQREPGRRRPAPRP
jgi:hypothetical protein